MKKIISLLLVLISLELSAQNSSQDTSKVSPDKKFLILPIVISTPETKFGIGTVGSYLFKPLKDTTARTSNIQGLILYTLRKQLLLELGGNIYTSGERYIIRWQSSFSHFPDRFYGLGDTSQEKNRELYTFTELYLNTQIVRKLYKRWFAGVGYEYQNIFSNLYKPDGNFIKQDVPGRDGSIASGIGPILTWDSRNNAFSPNKGEFFQFTYARYDRILGSNFRFNKYTIDARNYIKSFSKNVLASQLYGEFNSGNVPFKSLVPMGGPNLMRGYYLGRYRDKEMIVLQTEYRMPVWRRFGIVGFGGLGEVSDRIKNFSLSGIKYSLGGGIRFAVKPKEKLNIRLDYGIGSHSSGVYLYITEAF